MSEKYEVVVVGNDPVVVQSKRLLLEHRKGMVFIFDEDSQILFATPEVCLSYVRKV